MPPVMREQLETRLDELARRYTETLDEKIKAENEVLAVGKSLWGKLAPNPGSF
jgi:hypothetical protein